MLGRLQPRLLVNDVPRPAQLVGRSRPLVVLPQRMVKQRGRWFMLHGLCLQPCRRPSPVLQHLRTAGVPCSFRILPYGHMDLVM